jgi:putative DNA primase/helicase
MAATAAYRTESDVLGAFLEDACEFGQAYEVTAADIYHAYSRWASEGGEYAMSQTAFGRRLEERGIPSVKRSGAKWRRGLRLSSPSIAKQEELY